MQAVLDVLEDVQRVDSDEWEAVCPAEGHDSRERKLRLGVGNKKPVVVECMGKHADDYESVQEALTELGVTQAVLAGARSLKMPPRRRKKALPAPTTRAPVPPELDDPDKVYDWHAALKADRYPDLLEHLLGVRGLTSETIDRYKLGGGPAGITIPIRVEGKWRNVKTFNPRVSKEQGRWTQRKRPHGVPVLYPSEVLVGNVLPVLLCESEFDALLANQESAGLFVAVTGTSGAGTIPSDLWRLSNREVFIAYDADAPGRAGALKVQAALL